MTTDTFLTRKQLADLLHCSIRTIHNHQNSGLLPPPSKVGRRHLWLKSDLIAFIKAQSTDAARLQASERPEGASR